MSSVLLQKCSQTQFPGSLWMEENKVVRDFWPHLDAVVPGFFSRGLFFNLHVESLFISSRREATSFKKHLYHCMRTPALKVSWYPVAHLRKIGQKMKKPWPWKSQKNKEPLISQKKSLYVRNKRYYIVQIIFFEPSYLFFDPLFSGKM